jgi:hypothetical protein
MSGRPRTARGATGRDAGKENDLETDLLARIVEGVKKAKEHNDECQRIGQEIMALEGDIKSVGRTLRYFWVLNAADRRQTRLRSSIAVSTACTGRK